MPASQIGQIDVPTGMPAFHRRAGAAFYAATKTRPRVRPEDWDPGATVTAVEAESDSVVVGISRQAGFDPVPAGADRVSRFLPIQTGLALLFLPVRPER